MYTKAKFEDTGVAVEALKPIGNRFKFDDDDIELTTERVNELKAAVIATGFVPEIVIHSTWVTDDKTKKLKQAAFTVKPAARSGKSALSNCKLSFHVLANESFYSNFVYNLARWADNYTLQTKYQENLDELQAVFDTALADAGVPFKVNFELGSGVIDVADDYITLGISADVVSDLATNELFYTMIPGSLDTIRAKLGEAVKTCTKPLDIVKLNNYTIKSLGIYSRKQYKGILRNIVTRRVQYSRVGDSYVDTDNYFAVVTKVAVTKEAAAEMKNAYIVENGTATKSELAAGKTKIAISYKVSPFNDEGTVDVDIKNIEGIVAANVL